MIYITGDCHQEFRRFSTRNFPEQKEMSKEDVVLICGDFGASSHDIDGGILEADDPAFKSKKKILDTRGLSYRVNHLSWWAQELPSEEEMEEGRQNLAARGNQVDFIVTHCCASSTQALMSAGRYKPDILTNYLEEIRQAVKFKKWFFGHYHDNQMVSPEEILLYEQLIRIR